MSRTFDTSAMYALVATLGCLLLAGCGGAPDGKCLVAGVVNWNGQPLERGVITLLPIDGKFAGEAGDIEGGRFKFYARPGKNRVEISAMKETGYSEAMRQKILRQYLPAEFNSNSKLVKDIPNDGDEKLEFSLTGKAN